MAYEVLAVGGRQLYSPQGQLCYCYHVKEYNYPDLCRDIPSQKHNMICINDTAETTDFEVKKQGVIDAFEKLLPEKSTFEL